MPIRVKCENCKKTLSVKDHLAGKKIKCPVCQSVVLVAASASATKEPSSSGDTAHPSATNPAAATKPKVARPTTEKPTSNGTPANGSSKSNGVPATPPEPAPAARPPENIEDEALSAFQDEPKEEADEGPPQTIDFSCPWCGEDLHLALDMGGKQAPCPNEDCKRIIKIPMPKIVEKKDWRKMDRRGPALALINQPEQLDDAWGTEEATKARQASLLQAGAIEVPKKPGIGVFGWIGRAFYGACAAALLVVVGMVGARLMETNTQINSEKEVTSLLKDTPPKIVDPLLSAEAYRTLAELQLRANSGKAKGAKDWFAGARAMAAPIGAEVNVHKQMFLLELALSQIDLGGTEDEAIGKNKLYWKDAYEEIYLTLKAIHPDAQLFAVREVVTRLLDQNQSEIANSLAGRFSNQDLAGKRPLVAAQQIALLKVKGDTSALAMFGKLPDVQNDANKGYFNAPVRVGSAEGLARKGNYQEALALAQLRGTPKDRLEAALGVAAVALSTKKNKDEASQSVKAALTIAKDKATPPLTPWQQLQLIRLGLRTDEASAVKDMIDALPLPFKLRAQLEVFHAHCENTAALVTADSLPAIAPNDDKDGVTLALAWLHLARHNARHGGDRAHNRAAFERYLKISPPANPEMIRPMIDLGTYQGTR